MQNADAKCKKNWEKKKTKNWTLSKIVYSLVQSGCCLLSKSFTSSFLLKPS